MFDKVDNKSPIALYIQIRETIRSAIEKKIFQPGELIPGESELCDYFSVSRTVVRQAFDDLFHEGMIIRKKGKGTFVSEPKILERFGQKLTGFHFDMSLKGYQVKTEILQKEIIPATKEIADLLSVQVNEPLILIKRRRFINDEPVLLVTSYLPQKKAGDLMLVDLETTSLYDYLENQFGLTLSHGQRTIEAISASTEQARLLCIKKRDPLLMLNSISFLSDGTPIEYYRSFHRADRFKFEVDLITVEEDLMKQKITLPSYRSLPPSEGILKNINQTGD